MFRLVQRCTPLTGAARRRLASNLAAEFPSARILGGAAATDPAAATFRAWHTALEQGLSGRSDDGMAVLRPHVSDTCVFKPPTYFKPWVGGDEFCMLMDTVGGVFGESFVYDRQWLSDDGKDWALEFSAEVGGKKLDGMDLVRLDEHGKICEFSVVARPPNTVALLKKEMMARVPLKLAALKAKQVLGM